MSDTISDSLNLAPIEQTQSHEVEIINDNTTNVDFEYARGNIISAIEKGQQALTDVVDFAARTQSPRTFEAVAQILNAVTSANKELLDLSKKKIDIEKVENSTKNPSTVNNNLFVGSTAELLKMLKDNDKQQ